MFVLPTVYGVDDQDWLWHCGRVRRPAGSAVGTFESLYVFIGERIQQTRAKAGMTQDGVAREVGLSRTSITNIESGRQRVPLHQLLSIADALKVELRDLVPLREDLSSGTKVTVRVGQTEKIVSPMTARFIEKSMEKRR